MAGAELRRNKLRQINMILQKHGIKYCRFCGEFRLLSEFHAQGEQLRCMCSYCRPFHRVDYRERRRALRVSGDAGRPGDLSERVLRCVSDIRRARAGGVA